MLDDENIPLPVIDILRNAYIGVAQNIKFCLIFGYIFALPVYLLSNFLPGPSSNAENFDATVLIAYLALSLIAFTVVSMFFYRLFAVSRNALLKITFSDLLKIFFKMAAYMLILLFVLFLAILTLVLLFGLADTIIEAIAGENAISQVVKETVVNFVMLIMMLLIILRVQPTFISIAIGKAVLPMKSAYYYTRDNNKQLVLIGLFSFIPAMLPSTAALMLINNVTSGAIATDLVAYILFPVLLLPNILVMSAGAEIYRHLIPQGPDNKNHVTDISV